MRRRTPKDGAADRIRRELEALADPAYRDFQAKLVPTVDPARILGVRTPALRSYARRLADEQPAEARAFLAALIFLANVTFVLYDVAVARLVGLYCAKLRPRLLHRP